MEKGDLFPDYIATRSGHSRGSTVDLTIVPVPVPPQPEFKEGDPLLPCFGQVRFPDNSLDMGCGFDCFHESAHTGYEGLTPLQRGRRAMLVAAMEAAGFKNYELEWWHFTLRGEPFPDEYFSFPVR
jgi:D-alanyl-D-alanine dipeptidase